MLAEQIESLDEVAARTARNQAVEEQADHLQAEYPARAGLEPGQEEQPERARPGGYRHHDDISEESRRAKPGMRDKGLADQGRIERPGVDQTPNSGSPYPEFEEVHDQGRHPGAFSGFEGFIVHDR